MKKTLLSIFSLFSMYILSAQQDVLWEKSIGGENSEYLYNAISTPDYGFLIIGSSSSDATGDIQKKNQGGLDYFIWKMDENGKQEWQNSFGGNDSDLLYTAKNTPDGGYILVGASNSSKSGDKSTPNQGGKDIWIIKIDANGNIQWEKSFGGNGDDIPVDVITTKDKGFLIASISNSPSSELKKSTHYGGNDYYIIKLDQNGKLLWENSFGGEYDDNIKNIVATKDGFLLIGNSNSPESGNKNQNQKIDGTWIVSIDQNGQIIKENNLGIDNENYLISIQKEENQLFFGIRERVQGKSEIKIIKTDELLNILDNTSLEVDSKLTISSILKNDKQYILTANEISNNENNSSSRNIIKSFYITNTYDLNGKSLWNKNFGDDGFNYLEKAITTRDGSLILFGNSTQQTKGNKGQSDFYLVKLGDKSSTEKRTYIEAYPNPTQDFVNVLINKDFEKASIEVYNLAGQHLQSKEVKYRSTPISLGNYPAGVYILKINYDNQIESIKIIKK
ncbi:T9SS type A sorting domain-containing protein [Empedobacter falsenii]